jgi:hypothetical protein
VRSHQQHHARPMLTSMMGATHPGPHNAAAGIAVQAAGNVHAVKAKATSRPLMSWVGLRHSQPRSALASLTASPIRPVRYRSHRGGRYRGFRRRRLGPPAHSAVCRARRSTRTRLTQPSRKPATIRGVRPQGPLQQRGRSDVHRQQASRSPFRLRRRPRVRRATRFRAKAAASASVLWLWHRIAART